MLSCSFCKHPSLKWFFFISTLFHPNKNIETCLQFIMFSADLIMTTDSQESENSMTTTSSHGGSETPGNGNDKRTNTQDNDGNTILFVCCCVFEKHFQKENLVLILLNQSELQ